MLPGPKNVEEPEKELRFTRSAQAQTFYICASLLLVSSVTFIAIAYVEGPISYWMACIPILLALPLLYIGYRCNRYAYILLTPLGVEIFPFRKARENLQVIYWSQIDQAEVKDDHLFLHFDKEQTGGVVATLKPILPHRRLLMKQAIEGVMANRLKEEN